MAPEEKHRRLVKHFDVPGHAHLLTFSCHDKLPLLADDKCARCLSQAVDAALARHRFCLIAFVFMPEHVHLLVLPESEPYSVAKLLYAIKKPSSERIRRQFEAEGNPRLERLTVSERPGKQAFRFWEKGPGHDRNLFATKNLLLAADYLHNNPVKRGLVASPDLWKWSSWRFYNRPDLRPEDGLPRVHGFPG